MERTTRDFKTTGGHEIVCYDYVTGREQRAIQEVFLRSVEISRLSQTEGKTDAGVSGFSASAVTEAQDVAFKALVVTLDGSTENIVERILDLPASDYEQIVGLINEITDPKKK